jgi:Nif-specific regulatory protein
MTKGRKQEYLAKKLFSLLQAAQEVSSVRDTEKLLTAIVVSATKVIECNDSCLMLLRRETQELVAHVVVGQKHVEMSEVHIKVGEGIAGWVAQHGEPILSNDVTQDPRYARKLNQMTAMPLKSILCVPLILKDEVIGVLNIINKPEGDAFTEEDLHIAVAFANQAAIAIENARLYEAMSNENKLLREQLDVAPKLLKSFNPLMKRVIDLTKRAAGSDATVLLLGESGTGKEVIARAVHTWSSRKNYPFVALNCAALPEDLLESELFGHEKGSFTGAVRRKEGKIETARGGTLFLDEIGELKLDLQTKLLRILQEHQFERVGGTETLDADIRVIASTNRNLMEDVAGGLFREDLFYRLNVVSLTIPPLRARKEDILYIADKFIERYCGETGIKPPILSPSAKKALVEYDWPGNVRELENILERAIVLGRKEEIAAEDLFFNAVTQRRGSVDLSLPYGELLRNYKKEIITEALRMCGGNQSRAAKKLAIKQPYLSRLMKELGLREAKRTD